MDDNKHDTYQQELWSELLDMDGNPLLEGFEDEKDKSEKALTIRKTTEISKNFLGYYPSCFITAALPLRNTHSQNFERNYNNVHLNIISGKNVPYGKYSRLLLTIFTTHAVVASNDDGPLKIQYRSLGALLDDLQLPSSRGKNVKEQLDNFSSASFDFEEKISKMWKPTLDTDLEVDNDKFDKNGELKVKMVSTGHISFINNVRYLDMEDRKGEKATAAIEIILNQEFVKFSKAHSVPINYTVYKAIDSVLGKDLYAWFVYRNNSLGDKPLFVPRDAMVEQFMPVSENKPTEEKKKDQARANWQKIKEQIMIIKQNYYPELNVKIDSQNNGIELRKSAKPIESDDQRYMLITVNDKKMGTDL